MKVDTEGSMPAIVTVAVTDTITAAIRKSLPASSESGKRDQGYIVSTFSNF